MTNHNPSELHSIVKLVEAKKALAEAHDLRDVIEIKNKAESVRSFLKAAGYSLDIQNEASELRIRAERQAGELLEAMKESGQREAQGGARQGTGPKPRYSKVGTRPLNTTPLEPSKMTVDEKIEVVCDAAEARQARQESEENWKNTLDHLGIEKYAADKYRKLASIPDEYFESHIAEVKHDKRELTTAGTLRLVRFAGIEDREPLPAIPATLAAQLAESEKFHTISQAISAIRREVRELAALPCGRHLRDAAVANIDAMLGNVVATLRACAPHAQCPYCRGGNADCEACRDVATNQATCWVSYSIYKQAPEGLKTATDITVAALG